MDFSRLRLLDILLVVITLLHFPHDSHSFTVDAQVRHTCSYLLAKENDKNEGKGYRFGDITRSLLKTSTSRVKNLTGKDSYEFGDLSRWLDQKAKESVNNVTGNKKYKFGDLTRWVDQQAKEQVSHYTGKDKYQAGDISKEVVRRVMSGEYELQDVLLALRVLLAAGISLTPIASALPVKVVLELVNVGLAQELGGKAMDALGKNLDERFKQALTGDSKYQLGDITKRELEKSLSAFTGKKSYEFGDVTRKIASLVAEQEKENKTASPSRKLDISKTVANDLASWDKRFLEESELKK